MSHRVWLVALGIVFSRTVVPIVNMVEVANELPTKNKTLIWLPLSGEILQFLHPGFVHVSLSTVIRSLHEAGLHARRKARHPLFNKEHRVSRRTRALDHRHWTAADWRNCLSDESRYALYHSDRHILMWREWVIRYHKQDMTPTVAFEGGSLTVWGGISLQSRTKLVILILGMSNGIMTYSQPIIIPFT